MKPELSQPSGSSPLQTLDATRDGAVESRPVELEAGNAVEPGRSPASAAVDGEPKRGALQRAINKAAGAQSLGSSGTADMRSGAKKFPVKKISILVSVVLLLAAGSFAGYQNFVAKPKADEDKAAPPVVSVTAVPASMETVEDILSVTGSVSAWDPLSVGAEVSGLRITAVNVEEGDTVKKGQTLALLNSALLRAQLDQLKARLLSTEASHKKSIQPNRPEDILGLRAALAHAEANASQEEAHQKQAHVNLANAELNATRYGELSRVGAVSSLDAETKHVAAQTAREEIKSAAQKVRAAHLMEEQAKQRLLMAERGGRTEDVEISRAAVAETRAQIENLEQQIQQTIIRAPDDGLVSKRDAHIGDITSAGKPLFSMIRLNKLELRAQVNDIDLHKFHQGQEVKISTHENEKDNVIGIVRLVSPQVDPVSRLGTVRIELPANAGLKTGMFVRGEVNVGNRQAVTVPSSALVTRNGESYVFALDGTKAVGCAVKVGVRAEKFVEITEGLDKGRVVISKGARFLSDGDIVQVSK